MATKTKTKPKKTTKVSAQQQQWASQAALESLVRYQPQVSVLEQAYNDAQQTYQQKVDAAKTFNTLQQQSIAQAGPQVDAAYGRAGAQQDVINGAIQGGLGKLSGDVAAPFQAAAQLGAGSIAAAGVGERARAQASFGQQAVETAQGAGYQADQAHSSLVDDLTKILAQRQDVAQQQGAFQALTYDQLHQAAQKLAHDTNIHDASNDTALTIAAGHDATSLANALTSAASKTKGKGLLPGGVKPLTTLEQNTIIGHVRKASNVVSAWRGKAFPGNEETYTVYDPKIKRNVTKTRKVGITLPDGTSIKPGQVLSDHAIRQMLGTPNNPSGVEYSPDEVNAAFDIAVNGGLSKANIVALHNAGVKINGRLSTTPRKPKPKSKIAGLKGHAGPGTKRG